VPDEENSCSVGELYYDGENYKLCIDENI